MHSNYKITKCLYTGLALSMPCIGWLYTGLEKKTSYSILHYFRSVHDNYMVGEQFYEKAALRLVSVLDLGLD